MNNQPQQSCFSLLELSPVPTSYPFQPTCYANKVNNFLISDRPSSLYQLPSTTNLGSTVLDGRTEDPKKDLHYLNYNRPVQFGNYNNYHNDNIGGSLNNHQYYFPFHNNPETHDFYNQDQEMNNISHRMDSVNLDKKDSINQHIHNDAFCTENENYMKSNLILTPPPGDNLFGNIQICSEINTHPLSLTPGTQKNKTSQHSLQSNIPTPNIGQIISQTNDKFTQGIFQSPFSPFTPQLTSQFQSVPIYSLPVNQQQIDLQNSTGSNQLPTCTNQENFTGLNTSLQNMHLTNSQPTQNEGKKDYYEKVKLAMNNHKDQKNNFLISYSQQPTMQQSTNSMNSQTSISSSSSINDPSIHINSNKMIYSHLLNLKQPYQNLQSSAINSSIPISSSQTVCGNSNFKQNNLPFSMTTSVNNIIMEEQDKDIKNDNSQNDHLIPHSKDQSNTDDDGNENSNNNNQKLLTEQEMQEFARKVDFCKCKKSKCLKLYCECFLRGNFCNESCICTECGNKSHSEEREKAIDEAKTRNQDAFNLKFQVAQNQVKHKKGCNCKKTHCLKKYCECYNAGLKCTGSCKCEDCKNTQDGLKKNGGGGGANINLAVDTECNSQEITSIPQMITTLQYQMSAPETKSNAIPTSVLQNKKRNRNELADQALSKNSSQNQQQSTDNEGVEPDIRKKKNVNNSKQSQGTHQKSLFQQNLTSYNSFDQNFIFTSLPLSKNNSASSTMQNLQKKVQS